MPLAKGFSDEPRYSFTTDRGDSPDDLWTDLSAAALLCAGYGVGRIDESYTRRTYVPAESDPTKLGLSKPKRLSTYDMSADRHCKAEVRAEAVSMRSVSLAALDIKD